MSGLTSPCEGLKTYHPGVTWGSPVFTFHALEFPVGPFPLPQKLHFCYKNLTHFVYIKKINIQTWNVSHLQVRLWNTNLSHIRYGYWFTYTFYSLVHALLVLSISQVIPYPNILHFLSYNKLTSNICSCGNFNKTINVTCYL